MSGGVGWVGFSDLKLEVEFGSARSNKRRVAKQIEDGNVGSLTQPPRGDCDFRADARGIANGQRQWGAGGTHG